MKYIFFLAFVALSRPGALLAHDGSAHAEMAWYQEIQLATILVGLVLVSVIIASSSYCLPQFRKVFAGVWVASMALGIIGFQINYTAPAPITESVIASLNGVPVTVYRTEGCMCCSEFAKELSATGAQVAVETISETEMRSLKSKYGIAQDQESCHTSVIDDYVVEGHVPFEAIAQLVDNRPAISGITLPGMPIGTPGMPGKQAETYTVNTLEGGELFWQSS